MATSDTSTPARATASATPSAWSERSNALVTASPFCESKRAAEVGEQGDGRQCASRAACSGVNGTGGTTGRGDSGAGAGRVGGGRLEPGGGVGERAAGAQPGLEAEEPA